MLYISKGIPRRELGNLTIDWRGKDFALEDRDAQLWLAGRFDTALAGAQALEGLLHLGLVDAAEADDPLLMYRVLTNCIICPVPLYILRWPLRPTERKLWRWIKRASLRLSLAELTFLLEEDVRPVPELLGQANRQALVEMIYTTETIADGLLEARMEQAWGRDAIVEALLRLLRKRRIFLL